jgi:hypothetical protein
MSELRITEGETFHGHIAWDDATSGQLPMLVINGKSISWQQFGQKLMEHEGFHFKMQLSDGSEEAYNAACKI